MLEFRQVRCPVCDATLLEVATGMVRIKCSRCKRRVWISSDGNEVRIGMVDSARERVGGQ